jgi:hypothetical protein
LDTASATQELPESSLKSIERMLNTQGNIIGEDATDPMTDEEEIFEAGRGQGQKRNPSAPAPPMSGAQKDKKPKDKK